MSYQFDITVDPGLEDVAAQEVTERCEGQGLAVETTERPWDLDGHVEALIDGELSLIVSVLEKLHSAYYLLRVHDTVELSQDEEPLAPVYERLETIPLPELEEAESFCVRTRRVGSHSFSSPEVEREGGGVLWRRFGTKVNLTEPECTVRIDVTDRVARVGVLYGNEALNKRFNWAWRPRVTLRTTIAYGMLRLAGFFDLPADATLLDPFCGSGTIPIEAASLRTDLRLLASDWDEGAVVGARANVAAAGFTDRIELSSANALAMEEVYDHHGASIIVTNPPFGVRLAKETNMLSFYKSFLRGARKVLEPGGRLVILVGHKRKLFNLAVEQLGNWRIIHVRIVELGGIFPGIFVLE